MRGILSATSRNARLSPTSIFVPNNFSFSLCASVSPRTVCSSNRQSRGNIPVGVSGEVMKSAAPSLIISNISSGASASETTTTGGSGGERRSDGNKDLACFRRFHELTRKMTAGLERETNSGNTLSTRLRRLPSSIFSCCSRRSWFCADSIIRRSAPLSSHDEFRLSKRRLVDFIPQAFGFAYEHPSNHDEPTVEPANLSGATREEKITRRSFLRLAIRMERSL